MKKSVLTGLLLSTIFTSSIYAVDNKRVEGCMKGDMQNHQMQSMNHQNRGEYFSFMRMVHQVNLSDEQISKIKDIMKNHNKNIQKENDAFTKTTFDKQKYIEIGLNKHKNMLESKANLIESIYKVLTSKQKEELKVLMDLKANRVKNKGMENDKYCHGRR